MTGKELRALRKAAGVSRSALAAIMDMDEKSVGRKERGETPITVAEEFFFTHKLKPRL